MWLKFHLRRGLCWIMLDNVGFRWPLFAFVLFCVNHFCIWFLLQNNPGEIEIDWDVIDRRLLELDGVIVTS